MYKPISKTARCNLFQEISTKVWNDIIRAHRVHTDLSEVGITANIIVDILTENLDGIGNFNVFVKPGWNEYLYGSDLDIFIETQPGGYRWFALQAKILKKNNRYTTLRDTSDDTMQWEKLKLLEAISGCKSYYLLYNGKDDFTSTLLKDCKGDFFGNQFGCSLVEPNIIEHLATKKSGIRFVNPTFEDIHPKYAIPWRRLTCCLHSKEDSILYKKKDILSSDPNFIDYDDIDKAFEQVNQYRLPEFTPNSIAITSEQANWKPDIRIIINRTDSLF